MELEHQLGIRVFYSQNVHLLWKTRTFLHFIDFNIMPHLHNHVF